MYARLNGFVLFLRDLQCQDERPQKHEWENFVEFRTGTKIRSKLDESLFLWSVFSVQVGLKSSGYNKAKKAVRIATDKTKE